MLRVGFSSVWTLQINKRMDECLRVTRFYVSVKDDFMNAANPSSSKHAFRLRTKKLLQKTGRSCAFGWKISLLGPKVTCHTCAKLRNRGRMWWRHQAPSATDCSSSTKAKQTTPTVIILYFEDFNSFALHQIEFYKTQHCKCDSGIVFILDLHLFRILKLLCIFICSPLGSCMVGALFRDDVGGKSTKLLATLSPQVGGRHQTFLPDGSHD